MISSVGERKINETRKCNNNSRCQRCYVYLGGGFVVIFTLYNNLWNVLTEENGLYFTIFPNIVLIAFCMLSKG